MEVVDQVEMLVGTTQVRAIMRWLFHHKGIEFFNTHHLHFDCYLVFDKVNNLTHIYICSVLCGSVHHHSPEENSELSFPYFLLTMAVLLDHARGWLEADVGPR